MLRSLAATTGAAALLVTLGSVLSGSVLFGWVVPATARAQDLAIRVTPEGLDTLGPVLLDRLPPSLAIGAFDRQLFNCPATDNDIVAHVPDVEIALVWRDLALVTEDGALVVEAQVDLEIDTTAEIERAYACFGHATCDVHALAQRIGLRVEVAAASSPDGEVTLEGVSVALDLRPEHLDLDSEGCAIGDAAEWLIETFEGWVVERVVATAEEKLSERVAEALSGVLDETVALSIERAGFSIDAGVAELDLRAQTGLTLVATADVAWAGDVDREGPMPPVAEPLGPALPDDFGPGQFQLALSDRLVTEALYHAWRGGLLSGALAGRVPTFELGSEGVVQQLGLRPGTRVGAAIDIEEPATASFGRDGTGLAEIALRGLRVDLELVAPAAPGEAPEPPRHITIHVDGDLVVGIAMDPAAGGLVPLVDDLEILRLSVDAGDFSLDVDPARLAELVRNTVTPILAERFSGVPVAPALHSVAGLFAYVRTLETQSGWQRIGVDLVVPDRDDAVAPETFLVEPAALVPAGTVRFDVSGEDDTTPTPLLRYRAWLDGEALHDSPTGLAALRVDVSDGMHVLEVAAVDLTGNEDRSVATHRFTADGIPPELVVRSGPDGVLGETIVRASWAMRDPGGDTVEGRWELRRIDDDGGEVVVDQVPFAEAQTSLEVADLEPGELYELSITARDRAGNVTSETRGFAVHPNAGGGCAAGSARGVPVGAAGAALLWLGYARTRRRRR